MYSYTSKNENNNNLVKNVSSSRQDLTYTRRRYGGRCS